MCPNDFKYIDIIKLTLCKSAATTKFPLCNSNQPVQYLKNLWAEESGSIKINSYAELCIFTNFIVLTILKINEIILCIQQYSENV